MNRDRIDVPIIVGFALVAAIAALAPLVHVSAPLRLLAVLSGILFGPGGLAYRLATEGPWTECLTIGIAINIAIVMLLALSLVSAHFWYPIPFEVLIPLSTLILSNFLLHKELRSSPGGHR